jgi:hypothetical protein
MPRLPTCAGICEGTLHHSSKISDTFQCGGRSSRAAIMRPIDSTRPRWRHRSAAALTRSDVSSPAAISSTNGSKDWWGADLPVARGQNNFDILRYEYYRDRIGPSHAKFRN